MKKIFILGLLAVVLSACEHIDFGDGKHFTFSLEIADLTRASKVGDINMVICYDATDGKVLAKQDRGNASFGIVELDVDDEKEHKLVFIATESTDAFVAGRVYTDMTPVGDTFCKVVDVGKNSAADQTVTLKRIVALVEWRGEGKVEVKPRCNLDMASMTTSSDVILTVGHGESFYTFALGNAGVVIDGKVHTAIANHKYSYGGGSDEGGESFADGACLHVETDTADIYVSKDEIAGIVLNRMPQPEEELKERMGGWRMPTRNEANILRTYSVDKSYWSGARCLAKGDDAYYTFTFPGTSVTKAGQTVEYSVKPVVSVPHMKLCRSAIEIDFDWE